MKSAAPHARTDSPPQEKMDALVALYNQGQLAKVAEQAEALTQEYRSSFVLWNILGAACARMGRPEQAVSALRRAIGLNPNFPAAHYNLGIALKEQGKLNEAIAAFETSIAITPDQADVHYNIANVLKEQGKFDEAIASYRKALAIEPDHVAAHNNLGLALEEQGKLDEAIASYEKAVAIKPGQAEAHNNMGNALNGLGKFDEAIASYRKALAIEPGQADYHYNIANVLKDQGKFDEALAAYRKALAIEPGQAEVHNNMGLALKEQGKLDEAMACYRKALAIKPDQLGVYNNVGSVLKEQGRLDEAMASYKKALSIEAIQADMRNSAAAIRMDAIRNIARLPIGSLDKLVIDQIDKEYSENDSTDLEEWQKSFFEANLSAHNGELDEAANKFEIANRLKIRTSQKEAIKELASWKRSLNELRKWNPNPPHEKWNEPNLLLILGPSRSGKSTLERILATSNNVFPNYEAINIQLLRQFNNLPDLKSHRNTIYKDKLIRDILYLDGDVKYNSNHTIVTCTNPSLIRQIHSLNMIFSNLKIICIERESIQNIIDIYTKEYKTGNYYSYDIEKIKKYIKYYRGMSKIIETKLQDRVLIIKKRDLDQHPGEMIGKIAKKFNLEFEVNIEKPRHFDRNKYYRYMSHFLGIDN